MKVLHILNELKYSGAEIMYVDAAPIFEKLGCDLSVVNTTENLGEYAYAFRDAGYKVFHWPYPHNFISKIRYCNKIIKYIKDNNIDVLHIHRSDMRFAMAYCAWMAKIRSVYTFHNVFPTRVITYPYHIISRWIIRKIFKCKFQTISDSVYNHELNFYYNPTYLVYNWYGKQRFYPTINENEKNAIREELQISNNTLTIISVGGCSKIKQHTEIIKAIPEIIKAYPNMLYLHLGEGNELEEEIQLANKLGISDHIRFLGNQRNVRKFLIASDIYLMTSKFEGISITTIEAMACKIPTILYNVPGLKDFNKNEECSILIDPDFRELPKAISKLYNEKELRTKITNNAKKLVDNLYDIEKNTLKIYNLYIN